MHWSVAVEIAKECEDVSYEEWCNMYVDHRNPSSEQIDTASKTAHPILVRNGAIVEDVKFDMSER